MGSQKIAITSDADSLDAQIDQRFGRCKYFLVVEATDEDIKEVTAVENEGAVQGHGAGIKAAQQIGDLGVDAVITGNIGPNSTEVLEELGIKTYHASGRAKDAVEKFLKHELDEITEVAKAHSRPVRSEESPDERIFFPLLDNNGLESEISGHFGHAPFFGLYNTKTKEFTISENKLSHTDPDKSPVDQIIEAVNPTTVFALRIGARAIDLFNARGICLKTGDYRIVKEVIENLDKLRAQTSSCGH
ncbi:hypothetical protein HQ545_03130 [Candidatus Woesearchaeota archaeon]|nr:hypothetical protein [Candidatus Woesearchaeota archaeon]